MEKRDLHELLFDVLRWVIAIGTSVTVVAILQLSYNALGRGPSGSSADQAAAVFAVAGFLCVIFTYIGVNTLLPGIHSYA